MSIVLNALKNAVKDIKINKDNKTNNKDNKTNTKDNIIIDTEINIENKTYKISSFNAYTILGEYNNIIELCENRSYMKRLVRYLRKRNKNNNNNMLIDHLFRYHDVEDIVKDLDPFIATCIFCKCIPYFRKIENVMRFYKTLFGYFHNDARCLLTMLDNWEDYMRINESKTFPKAFFLIDFNLIFLNPDLFIDKTSKQWIYLQPVLYRKIWKYIESSNSSIRTINKIKWTEVLFQTGHLKIILNKEFQPFFTYLYNNYTQRREVENIKSYSLVPFKNNNNKCVLSMEELYELSPYYYHMSEDQKFLFQILFWDFNIIDRKIIDLNENISEFICIALSKIGEFKCFQSTCMNADHIRFWELWENVNDSIDTSMQIARDISLYPIPSQAWMIFSDYYPHIKQVAKFINKYIEIKSDNNKPLRMEICYTHKFNELIKLFEINMFSGPVRRLIWLSIMYSRFLYSTNTQQYNFVNSQFRDIEESKTHKHEFSIIDFPVRFKPYDGIPDNIDYLSTASFNRESCLFDFIYPNINSARDFKIPGHLVQVVITNEPGVGIAILKEIMYLQFQDLIKRNILFWDSEDGCYRLTLDSLCSDSLMRLSYWGFMISIGLQQSASIPFPISKEIWSIFFTNDLPSIEHIYKDVIDKKENVINKSFNNNFTEYLESMGEKEEVQTRQYILMNYIPKRKTIYQLYVAFHYIYWPDQYCSNFKYVANDIWCDEKEMKIDWKSFEMNFKVTNKIKDDLFLKYIKSLPDNKSIETLVHFITGRKRLPQQRSGEPRMSIDWNVKNLTELPNAQNCTNTLIMPNIYTYKTINDIRNSLRTIYMFETVTGFS